MDPLSATTGAFALIDVCRRSFKYLKALQQSMRDIDVVIDNLNRDIDSICDFVLSIERITGRYTQSNVPSANGDELSELLTGLNGSLNECETIAKKMSQVVDVISGKGGNAATGKRNAFRKEHRRRREATRLKELQDQLSTEKGKLQPLLGALGLYHQRTTQETLDKISTKMEGLNQVCRSSFTARTALEISIRNKFFDTPQPVSSFYTGRENLLEKLQRILIAPVELSGQHGQLRFVVHGMGGSGKTQFCCKFAEVNRESFWGIFHVDASSHETIKQSYARIAELGNLEHNHLSAMHWLSNTEGRWLLIMDNADDRHIDLSEYFPRGDRGCLLITTRNPDHIQFGNVTPGFFEFQGMSDDEASTLLLRAARMKEPWDQESSSCALAITRQLGSLALALVQAGAAIRCHLCKLKDYLGFYDKHWARIRQLQSSSVGHCRDRDDEYLSAHATFEVSYRKLEEMGTESSRDALQLLQMFSFFHPVNIRFDILRKAIENAAKEDEQRRWTEHEEAKIPLSWYQVIRNLRLKMVLLVRQDRSPAAFPELLREGRASGAFDDYRARGALRELAQMSLITYHASNDSYNIHPVIHRWARERPDMSASEQAVWAHAAALTLGHSILLPPLGDTEADELFRRDLLPHVDHVRSSQLAIDERIRQRRKQRFYGFVQWPHTGSPFGPDRALRYMKFSIVFAQNGRWKHAEELQLEVKRFADSVIGLDQSVTRRVTLALSDSYWNQGRGDEAGALQESVLEACMKYLPPAHQETLLAMDTLGKTRWQQGRYSVARDLQRRVLDGLLKTGRSEKHEDTLCAMGHLGRTLTKFHDSLEEAKGLLEVAYEGMKDLHGSTHLKSLEVCEDLAMLAIHTSGDLPSALQSMRDILDCRREKLGNEHPYTLLAMVNISRILTSLREYDEAEALVREGLSIADRTLGEGHIGTLMGRTVLGSILIHQSKLCEAEAILRQVIEKQRTLSVQTGDLHPDRIGALIELALCLRRQGKLQEGAQVCDTVIEGLRDIGQEENPLVGKMEARRDKMLEQLGCEYSAGQNI